VKREVREEGPT